MRKRKMTNTRYSFSFFFLLLLRRIEKIKWKNAGGHENGNERDIPGGVRWRGGGVARAAQQTQHINAFHCTQTENRCQSKSKIQFDFCAHTNRNWIHLQERRWRQPAATWLHRIFDCCQNSARASIVFVEYRLSHNRDARWVAFGFSCSHRRVPASRAYNRYGAFNSVLSAAAKTLSASFIGISVWSMDSV